MLDLQHGRNLEGKKLTLIIHVEKGHTFENIKYQSIKINKPDAAGELPLCNLF